MPDPFNRTKMSGDTHPPEVEPELPFGDEATAGDTADRASATERSDAARPGRGAAKRGEQPDRDHAPHSDRSSQR